MVVKWTYLESPTYAVRKKCIFQPHVNFIVRLDTMPLSLVVLTLQVSAKVLVKDISGEDYRHIGFATKYQLDLLAETKT
jgi:hypothetical protein